MCWLEFNKYAQCTTILTSRPETFKVVCYNINFTFYTMQNVTACCFIFMGYHVQMTIYWCVTDNESGLINSTLVGFHVALYVGNVYLRYLSIGILFKLTFL